MNVLVCGAGGFIGGHLVKELLQQGHKVKAVDIKPYEDWYQLHKGAKNFGRRDLSDYESCEFLVQETDQVYNLAADMGGMGFIENNKALCMLSVLINTNLLKAIHYLDQKRRFFFASSACVYNTNLQDSTEAKPLKESDAYPPSPEDGYGWEKLFSERMCRHFYEDFQIETRVARYHNVYGPHGTYVGGREKAPAAICRKVILAKMTGERKIEIWGTGEQTRSFMWIDDCIKGTTMLMNHTMGAHPVNLGSSELVSINQLVDIVEEIAGVKLKRVYKRNAPKGVNGRNSDNTLIKNILHWEPTTPLREGMEQTYRWIWDRINAL